MLILMAMNGKEKNGISLLKNIGKFQKN